MFLRRRATQAEYTDEPGLPASVVEATYRELAKVNRIFQHSDPFTRLLPRWLGEDQCRKLTLLDLGAGDGSLGHSLETWAADRGWSWNVTNLDINPLALRLNPHAGNVVGSVQALPFPDNAFDLVIASQMTHHLSENHEVIQHFTEAWRVARRGVYITDLHRNAALYALLWVLLRIMRMPPFMIEDGLLSVHRGWRVAEWRALARQAGLDPCRVWVYYGSRIILSAKKAPRIRPAVAATAASIESTATRLESDGSCSVPPRK